MEIEKLSLKHPIYSFLSVNWGILADIDIESEKIRFLGGYRFETWALWRILNTKSYKGTIYLNEKQDNLPNLREKIDLIN